MLPFSGLSRTNYQHIPFEIPNVIGLRSLAVSVCAVRAFINGFKDEFVLHSPQDSLCKQQNPTNNTKRKKIGDVIVLTCEDEN